MSLPDQTRKSSAHISYGTIVLGLSLSLVALSACTVRPLYSLTLDVTAAASSAATIQRALEEEPTASMMTVGASYVLTDAKTGEVVAQGRREASSSYDVPRQSFAAARAQRDAENRAARELAELLKLVIAQDLSKAAR
jgi:LPS-assembly lipoprotein